ncbi:MULTISPECIES: DegT/DnrJ/EryC1/StrS aminotransferase family protein [Pseudomonas]|uniref:Aminotransferase DegT n=1 Tax=Pseudomonas oryzihabitans TaxID=47885 RepID=A0A178LGS5_9PSED|nr:MULTISPECIES: DegT/DnrJ/EryC1/StrS family aminotransferase [Pseudomonas]OAN29925.1 aminotransferase DegT [Pseudomonas oryzihabitans]SEP09385.1 dTDP-4-amino-4,6-dideoxygalactose transaminase [Pseudomonas sp. Snoq117.2]
MINVTKPYLGDKERFKAYIDKIYANNWITNQGPLHAQLEERLRDYLGVRNIILVNNGTLALQVAYRALGLSGSAITTPFSFVATTSTLHWEGIRPVFADIHPETWNLDPANVEAAIEPDTSAIVATHVFGNPCDVRGLQQVANRHGLKVVYDGAHAFGTRFEGRSVLQWGDITTVSFHATKLFHTIEGGAIITDDDELAERVRRMINFGIVDAERIEGVGINAKLNEVSAAMGLCILDELEDILARRAVIGQHYERRLQGAFDLQRPTYGSQLNYSYFPVGLRDEPSLLDTKKALNAVGINPRRYFYPSLETLDYLQPQAIKPVSRKLSHRILCVPLYPDLPQATQDLLIDTLLLAQQKKTSMESLRALITPAQLLPSWDFPGDSSPVLT